MLTPGETEELLDEIERYLKVYWDLLEPLDTATYSGPSIHRVLTGWKNDPNVRVHFARRLIRWSREDPHTSFETTWSHWRGVLRDASRIRYSDTG